MICRHDCFEKLIVNDDLENKEIVEELMIKYKIKKVIVFAYHSQANEMMKKDHKLLTDVLLKMSNEEKK